MRHDEMLLTSLRWKWFSTFFLPARVWAIVRTGLRYDARSSLWSWATCTGLALARSLAILSSYLTNAALAASAWVASYPGGAGAAAASVEEEEEDIVVKLFWVFWVLDCDRRLRARALGKQHTPPRAMTTTPPLVVKFEICWTPEFQCR
jgi:hypothetical protein